MLKQVYNSRSKKWVLLDDSVKGGIKEMQAEPFENVKKVNKKPGTAGRPDPGLKTNENEPGEQNERPKKKSGIFGFFRR